MPRSLNGKVVLITGASSGFGADAAVLFAQEGCQVVLAARRMDRLEALAEQIQAVGGGAFALALDITEQTQIEEGVLTVLDRFGRIDILVNNSGFGRLNWLECLDPQRDIDAQIDVNLRGLIQMTRAVLPSMLARRSGIIINMASVAGRISAPLYTIYASTKYGVRGFTDALRREVGPFGVQVCGIYPASAATEFAQHTGSNSASQSLGPFHRLDLKSGYVARRIVGLAKHPHRSLVIPGWYLPILTFDYFFPGLVDWFLDQAFVKRFHKLEE
ncbi:MAG: SDR family NAD(P)-dependent oxidoreductase [Anaerolineales bacterium]|jgi:short-subunit dehydrogenase